MKCFVLDHLLDDAMVASHSCKYTKGVNMCKKKKKKMKPFFSLIISYKSI